MGAFSDNIGGCGAGLMGALTDSIGGCGAGLMGALSVNSGGRGAGFVGALSVKSGGRGAGFVGAARTIEVADANKAATSAVRMEFLMKALLFYAQRCAR